MAVNEGGFVAGYQNQNMGAETSILGGTKNLTNADHSVILGGFSIQTTTSYEVAQ